MKEKFNFVTVFRILGYMYSYIYFYYYYFDIRLNLEYYFVRTRK